MIKNAKRNYNPDSIRSSRKMYYMVIVDHKPKGICTSFEIAQACVKCYAQKYSAKEIGKEDVYIYEDDYGKHLIYIETIRRIRMPYNLDE